MFPRISKRNYEKYQKIANKNNFFRFIFWLVIGIIMEFIMILMFFNNTGNLNTPGFMLLSAIVILGTPILRLLYISSLRKKIQLYEQNYGIRTDYVIQHEHSGTVGIQSGPGEVSQRKTPQKTKFQSQTPIYAEKREETKEQYTSKTHSLPPTQEPKKAQVAQKEYPKDISASPEIFEGGEIRGERTYFRENKKAGEIQRLREEIARKERILKEGVAPRQQNNSEVIAVLAKKFAQGKISAQTLKEAIQALSE